MSQTDYFGAIMTVMRTLRENGAFELCIVLILIFMYYELSTICKLLIRFAEESEDEE